MNSSALETSFCPILDFYISFLLYLCLSSHYEKKNFFIIFYVGISSAIFNIYITFLSCTSFKSCFYLHIHHSTSFHSGTITILSSRVGISTLPSPDVYNQSFISFKSYHPNTLFSHYLFSISVLSGLTLTQRPWRSFKTKSQTGFSTRLLQYTKFLIKDNARQISVNYE